MATSWEDYIGAPAARAASAECRAVCAGAFQPLRRILERLIEAQRPRSVACLGAGVLNDIPFPELVRLGAEIHLVDWIPGIVDTGLAQSIIDRDTDGVPNCAFCALGDGEAPPWCRGFAGGFSGGPTGEPSGERGVCAAFEPGGGEAPVCKAYERGDRPRVHTQDATGGYASAFAHAAPDAARTAETWRQAIRHGVAAARRGRHGRAHLDIPDASIDLVTSSMVMSQFEHEPYGYFSRQVAARLGPPSARDERRLAQPLAALRDELVVNQLEGHLDEVERIMAPDGRLFAAFELFHHDAADGGSFLVPEMHRALDILGRRFAFDFDLLPARDTVIEMRIGAVPSVVHAFVLRRRPG